MDRSRAIAAIGVIAASVAIMACSPEATRRQGGDRGADVGNRSTLVELHGRQDMYNHTPALVPFTR